MWQFIIKTVTLKPLYHGAATQTTHFYKTFYKLDKYKGCKYMRIGFEV